MYDSVQAIQNNSLSISQLQAACTHLQGALAANVLFYSQLHLSILLITKQAIDSTPIELEDQRKYSFPCVYQTQKMV